MCLTNACSYNSDDVSADNSDSHPKPALTAGRVVNINTAAAAELETLPYIGPKLAQQIIEHREIHGPFRKPEHLMQIRGMSDKRFRAIRHLITVD